MSDLRSESITHGNYVSLILFRIAFWDVLPCKMIVDRCFRGAYCLHHQGWWWRQYASLKRRSTIILHGSTSQKTILNIILAAVRTWNLTCKSYFLTIFIKLSECLSRGVCEGRRTDTESGRYDAVWNNKLLNSNPVPLEGKNILCSFFKNSRGAV
jgi:hypothetical protein